MGITKGLLPCSQKLAICPCPEQEESSSCTPIPLLLRSILKLLSIYQTAACLSISKANICEILHILTRKTLN